MTSAKHSSSRLNRRAEIAVGPVFFVVAILGILASAIAVGSGSLISNQGTPAMVTVKMSIDPE